MFSQNLVFCTYFLEVIFDISFNWNYWLAYFFSQSLVYLWISSKPMSLLFCFYNCTKINVVNYQTLPFKFVENRMKLIQKQVTPFLHFSVLCSFLFSFHFSMCLLTITLLNYQEANKYQLVAEDKMGNWVLGFKHIFFVSLSRCKLGSGGILL